MLNSLHKINWKEKKYSPIDFTFATKWWHFFECVCLNSYTFNVHFSGKFVSNQNIVNIMCCFPNCKTDNNKSSRATEKIKKVKKYLLLHVSSTLFRCRPTSFFVGHTCDCCAPYCSMGNCGTFLWSVLIKIVYCLHYMSVVYNAIAAWLFAL